MSIPARVSMLASVSLLAVSLVAARAGAEEVTEAEFLAWVRTRAVPITTLDWRQVEPSRLAVLDPLLEGKRIVTLGETDHFVAERMEFRLILIRYLASRGFRNIGMEAGISDCKRIDRYIETGDRSYLSRVALYGYDGDRRYDRDDSVEGWTDAKHPEFGEVVRAEGRWFLDQLREISLAQPAGRARLRWFGYDMNMVPGGGYADAFEMLTLHSRHALVRELRQRLARVAGESRPEEYRRLIGVLAFIEQNGAAFREILGKADLTELERIIHCLADGVLWIESLQDLRDRERVTAGLRRREKVLCRQMDEILAAADPGEKFILLGHAIHLSKDSTTIKLQEELWPTLGAHLNETRPGEVYGIWFLFDHGQNGNLNFADPIRTFRTVPGSVENLLARVGPAFLLPYGSGDPREEYLAQPRTVRFMTNPGRANLKAETDAVFFISEVTACHER